MKIVIFLKIILLFIILASENVLSAEWLHNITVQSIEVQPNGNAYILTDKTVPNLGCQGNGSWLQFDKDSPLFEEQYSLVLAAYMANKKIRIYVNNCGYYPYAQNTLFEP